MTEKNKKIITKAIMDVIETLDITEIERLEYMINYTKFTDDYDNAVKTLIKKDK